MRVILCGKDELKSRVIDNVEQAELINNNTELVVNKPILDIESFNVQDYSNINIQDFDSKWQKLKDWLEEKKSRNERRLKEAPINTEFYIRVSVQGITINKILTIMQELEGE